MGNNREPIRLPGSITVDEAADLSRRALSAFVAMRDDKTALAGWLTGDYRVATSFGPPRQARARGSAAALTPSGALRVDEVIEGARLVVHAALAAASSPGAEALVACLPTVVHVLRVVDFRGRAGFVPFDPPRARLADRALSLLVADYMTRPDHFRETFSVSARPAARRSGFVSRVLPVHSVGGVANR